MYCFKSFSLSNIICGNNFKTHENACKLVLNLSVWHKRYFHWPTLQLSLLVPTRLSLVGTNHLGSIHSVDSLDIIVSIMLIIIN